jgi:hypothetical protein
MRRKALYACALALGTIGLVGRGLIRAQPDQPAQPQPPAAAGGLTSQQAQQLVRDAYVFGYPLVTLEYTRRQITNVARPDETHAPMGQFANMRKYPTADFKEVTAPNADTLYSSAFVDLSQDAYVFEYPDMGKRYFLMPILDGWTNVFADPGSRTTGGKAQRFLITGPGWSGTVPRGMTQLRSPTNLAWIVGRTYSTGTPEDYKAVHALQDRYQLTPLSAYAPGKKYAPPPGKVDASIDMKTPPREQVNALSGKEYFTVLASLMKTSPPVSADAAMVAKLAQIGIVPGKDFDPSKLDPQIASAIDGAPKDAVATIEQQIPKMGQIMNGWQVTKTGAYGTDYMLRAAIAFAGLGANLSKDAIYPTAKTDVQGQPLDTSKNNYVITFATKQDLPPVKGFWSLTLYNDQFFFYKNPLNRQTLSERDKLVANPDGSIDLYIQNQPPPKDKQANWLPAPKAPIVLILRLYWPSETPPSIFDGSWKPPAIKPQPQAQAQR